MSRTNQIMSDSPAKFKEKQKNQTRHEASNGNKITPLVVLLVGLVGLQASPVGANTTSLEHQQNLAEALRQLQWLQGGPNYLNDRNGTRTEPTGGRPSDGLAESTAAGTAAGLMVHDLMTQANRLDLASRGPPGEEGDDDQDHDQQLAGFGVPDVSSEADEDDQQPARPPASQRMFVQGQGGLMRQPSLDVVQQGHQLHQQHEQQQQQDGQEPPGEEQSPDSFEGLMRSEGENLDGAADEPSHQAGSNLILQQQPQLLGLEGQGDEHDEQEEEPEPSHLQRGESRPAVMMSGHELAGMPLMLQDRSVGPEGHLLAAQGHPSDSPIDLSAAAGHYYGKKKKKKVIIIKKKKKKKKKKVYKKVKIVKVKKLKKKKKAKKYYYPMKKKKKAHHDHGKYYM